MGLFCFLFIKYKKQLLVGLGLWTSGGGNCYIVMEWHVVMSWVGELLLKQLLMGLGEWTSRGKDAVS